MNGQNLRSISMYDPGLNGNQLHTYPRSGSLVTPRSCAVIFPSKRQGMRQKQEQINKSESGKTPLNYLNLALPKKVWHDLRTVLSTLSSL